MDSNINKLTKDLNVYLLKTTYSLNKLDSIQGEKEMIEIYFC